MRSVCEVKISPDGRWLACVGDDRRVLLLNWPAGTRVWQSAGSTNFAGSFRTACFSPCGRLLIAAAAEDVRHLAVWNIQTGERLGTLRGHTKILLGARFANDGRLVSWGTDGTIRTWDVQQRTALGVVSLAIPQQSS